MQERQEKRFYELKALVAENIKESKKYIKEEHLQECEDFYKNSWRSLTRFDQRGKFFPGIGNTCNFITGPPLLAKKDSILVVYMANISHSQSKSKRRKQIKCPFSITDGKVKLHIRAATDRVDSEPVCADLARYHGATITRR